MRNVDNRRRRRRTRTLLGHEASAATTETSGVKRLTLDLPESLHKTIKREAVEQGITMAQMLRTLLLKHYRVGLNAR